MSKSPKVIFKPQRIAEGEWLIEAHYPDAEVRYIKGMTSESQHRRLASGQRQNRLAKIPGLREINPL